MTKRAIAEAFGTFALVFAGTGAIIINEASHGAITHVGIALTFGLGATMLTRAGTQREGDRGRRPQVVNDMSWQTPTPVTGVAAARRPVTTVKES